MTRERVLVTGASSGIGLELAERFAADGSDLVLVARSENRLAELAAGLRQRHGVEVRVEPLDLRQPAAPRELFERLDGDRIEIDVLVNNAGFGERGSVANLDLQRQLDMVQVNVAAVTALTRLFLPGMIERNRGGVLNVGSTAGFQPGPYMTVYYATKAFVLSFSEGLHEELKGTQVRVSCLAPGPTTTGFAAAAHMTDSRLFRLGAMTAARVARAGHDGFRRGRAVVVPGLRNRFLISTARFSPRWLVRKITGALNR
jgi:short-subunit dehydrogenase